MKKRKDERNVYDGEDYRPAVKWYNHIPFVLKALVLKYWFYGLEYYLIEMGIGYFITDNTYAYLLMLLLGFTIGLFNELFVYNLLSIFENHPEQSKPYVFIKSKKLYSLFINVIYGIAFGFIVMVLFALLQNAVTATADVARIEQFGLFSPLIFAGFALVADAVFVGLKDLFVVLFRKFFHKEG
jgi:hypothetical protein